MIFVKFAKKGLVCGPTCSPRNDRTYSYVSWFHKHHSGELMAKLIMKKVIGLFYYFNMLLNTAQ